MTIDRNIRQCTIPRNTSRRTLAFAISAGFPSRSSRLEVLTAETAKDSPRTKRIWRRRLRIFLQRCCGFEGRDLAPILAANYELVHIDLGPGEPKNSGLVHMYEIPLNKGIPALAVAESDGKLVVSQKNGEFEDARGLALEALADLLNKRKPDH